MTGAYLEVLLTGVTGFLGHYLLAELLAHPRVRCHVVLRPPVLRSCDRLERLLAEIGLDLRALMSQQRVVPIEGALPDGIVAQTGGPIEKSAFAPWLLRQIDRARAARCAGGQAVS